jgi:hypothetical protein
MFKELGLDTDGHTTYTNGVTDKEFAELTGIASASTDRTSEHNPDRSQADGSGSQELQSPRGATNQDVSPQSTTSTNSKPWYSKLVTGRRPRIKTAASAPPPTMSTFTRLSSVALLIAVVLPGFSYYNGREKVPFNGADAGVINRNVKPLVETRADSPTDVCKRWSQQGRPPTVMGHEQVRQTMSLTRSSRPPERNSISLRRPSKDLWRPDAKHLEYAQSPSGLNPIC